MKSSLEIAQEAVMKPIEEIGADLGLQPEEIEPYGRYKAKIDLSAIDRLSGERELRLHGDGDGRAVETGEAQRAGVEEARAGLELEAVSNDLEALGIAGGFVRMQHLGGGVPWRAIRFLAAGVHEANVVELHRGPLPVEAAERGVRGRCGGWFAAADGPDAPRVVADAPPGVGSHVVGCAGDRERAGHAAVLGHARVVHDAARSAVAEEVRLFEGHGAALEREVEGEADVVLLGVDARRTQGLLDLDADGSDLRVHPIRTQSAGGADDVLLAADDDGREPVRDADVWVLAEGEEHVDAAVGSEDAVEVAIVEVAVAGVDPVHGLGRLVDEEVVGRREGHVRSLVASG